MCAEAEQLQTIEQEALEKSVPEILSCQYIRQKEWQ